MTLTYQFVHDALLWTMLVLAITCISIAIYGYIIEPLVKKRGASRNLNMNAALQFDPTFDI